MKKTIWLAVGIIIVVIIICATRSKFSDNKTTMAVLVPLTGGSADQGEWIKRGFDLALNELNQRSDKPKLSLVFEDTKGDPKTAVSIYNQLKSQFNISVIFTWGSGVGIALTPIVNKDKVIQVGIATASDGYSTLDDYTFRVFPSANQEGIFMASAILNQLHTSSVMTLNVNNDYGNSSVAAFRTSFEKLGGAIIDAETYDVSTTDFHTLLAKVKALSPGVVYISAYPNDGALLLRQAKDLGLKTQFIASTAILGGKNFFNVAGDSSEGLIVSNSAQVLSASSSSAVRHFAEGYNNAYKEEVGPQQLYSARPYDALNIISQAIDVCGYATDCIQKFLFNINNYDGASGRITFDRNGDIVSGFNLQIIRNGKFIPFTAK